MNPWLDTQLLQPQRYAIHLIIQLAIGQALTHEIDGRAIRILCNGILKDLLHWSGNNIDVPAHTSRIRLDPGHIVHVRSSTDFYYAFR